MKRKILIVLLCFFGLGVFAENTLEIVKLSQSEQSELISSFTKFKFRNDSIFVYDYTDRLVSKNALAQVRVLLFSEGENHETGIDEVQSDGAVLKVFPNPAIYQIRVENYEPVQSISVYALNGQSLAVETAVNENQATVNVSSLTEGSYILLVNQTAVKFIKK